MDNDCVADLNKRIGLEMLHVNDTSINIDGLLQLTALQNLKRLFISAEHTDTISQKNGAVKIHFARVANHY